MAQSKRRRQARSLSRTLERSMAKASHYYKVHFEMKGKRFSHDVKSLAGVAKAKREIERMGGTFLLYGEVTEEVG